MSRKPLDLARLAREKRIADAAAHADWVIQSTGITGWPVEPLEIAATEAPLLKVCCGNYRNRFDGRMEYHRNKRRFLMFYNTKYNANMPAGENAPRTRFSIAHELGHFYLEEHHDYLRRGGKPHPSRSEFVSDVMMEKEADTFAANLLMPKRIFRPLVNESELTFDRIEELAECFQTSRISTAIRAVETSDFYCAVAGIRDGLVCWTFPSGPLVRAGFYPRPKGVLASPYARIRSAAFLRGDTSRADHPGWAREWFRTFDSVSGRMPVTEEYFPIQAMNTLLVFLNIPEDEVFQDDDS